MLIASRAPMKGTPEMVPGSQIDEVVHNYWAIIGIGLGNGRRQQIDRNI
jgi:hypothetical protein